MIVRTRSAQIGATLNPGSYVGTIARPASQPAPPVAVGSVARSPVTWLLLSVVAGAVIYYVATRKRYAPNRAVSSEQAKSYLARSAARDKVRRVRDDHLARVKQVRADKRRVQRKVTKGCEASRKRTSQDVQVMRARERERINKKADAMRARTTKKCTARRDRVRAVVGDAMSLAQEERDERLRLAEQLVAAERKRSKRLASQERRQKLREEQSESDSEVEANIDPELASVWRKVKRDIRGTPKMSRTEAFLHWVEENDAEIWALREDEMAQELDDLAAEQAAYYEQQKSA